jgi:hypothetical protein
VGVWKLAPSLQDELVRRASVSMGELWPSPSAANTNGGPDAAMSREPSPSGSRGDAESDAAVSARAEPDADTSDGATDLDDDDRMRVPHDDDAGPEADVDAATPGANEAARDAGAPHSTAVLPHPASPSHAVKPPPKKPQHQPRKRRH